MGRPDVATAEWQRPIELRTYRRFELVLPVLFRWFDDSEHSDVGYCRNIGLGGVFVQTTKSLPVGTSVTLEVVISNLDWIPGELLLHFTGQVIRVEAWERLSGFAAAGRFEDEIHRRT
jgi:hypothetical protein